MKKFAAVIALVGASMFGFSSVAQAAPKIPNVEGMSRSAALSTLGAAGVSATVLVNGYDGKGRDCVVVRQSNMSNRYVNKYVVNEETGVKEFVRIDAPKAVLRVQCRKG